MKPFARRDYWSGRSVLVTGATGFLGGWLCSTLLSYGASLTAVVRADRPSSRFFADGLVRQATLVRADAADQAALQQALSAAPIDVAFHLTSLVDVNAALADPARVFHDTVDTTLALLNVLRASAPRAVTIVCSSDKVYGAQTSPFREDMPLLPFHPYEIAKAAQDQLARSYAKLYGMPIAITRCGNFFGGYDFHWERIIPYTIRQCLLQRDVVLRSDGKFTRDFLYIEEAVDAHLLLAEALSSDPSLAGEAFNFSHEVSITMLDLVRSIARRMGSGSSIRIDDQAKAEIPHMRLLTDKARTRLGWAPSLDFEDGLARTVDWYRDRGLQVTDSQPH